MTYKRTIKRPYKRKPGKWINPKTRKAIYMRDGNKCLYCKKELSDNIVLSLDHIIPWIYWGHDRHNNLVTCCVSCNSKRGAKKMSQWYKVLLKEEIATPEEVEKIKKYIKSIKRRSDSNIQKYRDLISGKKPYCKIDQTTLTRG